MAYRIGDRRFPWLAWFFDDPEGHEPREVSNGPVQMTALVNPSGASIVTAYTDTAQSMNDGQIVVAEVKAGQYPGYASGDVISEGLSQDYTWTVRVAALRCDTTAGAMTFGVAARSHESNSITIVVSEFETTLPRTGAYRMVPEVQGLTLPYGGYPRLGNYTGATQQCYIRAIFEGRRRELTS